METSAKLTRRAMLRSLLASSAFLNTACWAAPGPSPAKSQSAYKRLVLVELAGGNDGLNTVVPYSQNQYYKARPILALPKDQIISLDEHLGLHPELAPLMSAWNAQDLHIALGVGYPDPNRSHFRSIDIWNTASGNDKVLQEGWLANSLDEPSDLAEGIVFGGDFGPLLGSTRCLVLDKPEIFARRAKRMQAADVQTDNPALAHVIAVKQQVVRVVSEIQDVIDARGDKSQTPTGSDFHKQLSTISEMIAYGTKVPVLKATLKGFDTHYHQPNRHKQLMRDLAMSLSSFRQRLIASGDWQNTLVMSYSEFGRRPAENGSRGTDHGTSAPILIMGGSVRGGFSGAQPKFPADVKSDLAFNLDYRQLYHTVAKKWLGVSPKNVSLDEFAMLDFLKA